MVFDSWPDIHGQCPVCGDSGCATFRGYYKRFMLCTELEVFSLIVIRTGFCKRHRQRFSLLPDFLIPYRRISRFSLQNFIDAKARKSKLTDVIDDMTGDLGEEFYLPLSTAYSYLKLHLPQPP